MYTNYNIPQKGTYKPKNSDNYQLSNQAYPIYRDGKQIGYQDGDRFIPFLGPLLLGGLAGYALGRPNYPVYPPGPVPIYIPHGPSPYPQPYPVPAPYPIHTSTYVEPNTFSSYSNTNVYY